jgi:hypothetical protein
MLILIEGFGLATRPCAVGTRLYRLIKGTVSRDRYFFSMSQAASCKHFQCQTFRFRIIKISKEISKEQANTVSLIFSSTIRNKK